MPRSTSFGLRTLHAWLRRFLRQRFTPAGRLALALMGFSAALGIDTQRNMAYQIFCVVVAAFIGSLAGLRALRPQVGFQRELPRFATVGEPARYRLFLTNTATHPLRAAEIREAEVGGLGAPCPVCIDTLPAGQSTTVVMTTTPDRRGYLHLAAIVLAQPEYLGLLKALCSFRKRQSLLVLPRRYTLPDCHLPGHCSGIQGQRALPISVADAEEFQGLREYRPGDPLRLIHWKSWARNGKPVIREFQEEFAVRHALILDTFLPHAKTAKERLEEAISVAASFACTVDTRDNLLDLLFAGTRIFRETAGRGHGPVEHLLEVLAGIEASRENDFPQLHHAVTACITELSGAICILLDWDAARQAFIGKLHAMGLPLAVFVILDSPAAANPALSLPDGIKILRVGHVQEDLAAC